MDLPTQRILITGGAGFLGSVVVRELGRRGVPEARIFVPRSTDYDLVDLADVERLFDDFPASVVIHLAARVGGIGANQANPGRFFYDNLLMGAQLMEVARLRAVKKFVLAGTICSYPRLTPVPFREQDLWNGYPEDTNAPYGVAKKALLVQAQAYRQQYGFLAICPLLVNLYGPGDNFDPATSHVIPAIIKKCVDARDAGRATVELWGDGSPSREFLYVDDAAEGVLLATERYEDPEPVNLGTGREVTISALAEMIREHTGFTGSFVWDSSRPNGQPRRSLDVTRAAKCFGFRAITGLEQGLERTVRWYEENRDRRLGLDLGRDLRAAGT